MNEKIYLVLALITIGLLIAMFFITYILNKRTPIPKGCGKMPTEHCHGCLNKHCEYYQKEEN